ncbi:hypothetical protein ACWDX6_06700 [Streptomyces sp. NPDC003027]
MRAIRAALAALLAAGAVSLGASPVIADDGTSTSTDPGTGPGTGPASGSGSGKDITSFGFSVSPSAVAPGGTVTLMSEGCEVPSVTVESGVFDTVTLHEGVPGTATVDADAKAGAEYEVTFDCDGERGTAPLTITKGPGGHHPGDTPAATPTGPGAHKGVKAGFGGASGELGTAEVVTGTALIAGALGGGLLLLRRPSRDDPT